MLNKNVKAYIAKKPLETIKVANLTGNFILSTFTFLVANLIKTTTTIKITKANINPTDGVSLNLDTTEPATEISIKSQGNKGTALNCILK